MIRRDDRDSLEDGGPSADVFQLGPFAEKAPQGGRPERNEDFRTDDGDLRRKIGATRFQFVRAGASVRGRAALDDVRDKDGIPRESRCGERLVQDLSSRADEGPPGGIFIPARRLPDQEHVRVEGAFAGDRMDPAFVEAASRARADLLGCLLQNRAAVRLDAGHGRQRTGGVIAFAALRTCARLSGS